MLDLADVVFGDFADDVFGTPRAVEVR